MSEPSTGSAVPAVAKHRHAHSRASASIELQERERVRIGFDLHDGPAQTMSAALLQVKMLEDLEDGELQRGLVDLRATIAAALEEVYDLIESLGGRDPVDADLVSRVRSAVDAFVKSGTIGAELRVRGDAVPMSRSLEIAIFRIVQEALSNVSRHSGASHVDVALDLSPNEVVCEIADDGKGFTPEVALAEPRGREPYGLHSMQERARLLDGECVIDSAPGRGTKVRVRIPVWQA